MSDHLFPQVLAGKVAAVTGGVRGIGGRCVARLAAAGARVAIVDRSPDEGMPSHDHLARCDVAEEAAVVAAFAGIAEALGPIDILVNGAGLTVRAPALDMRAADFTHVISVNLTGAFLCAREAARQMRGRGGAIVSIASVMGLSGGLFPNVAYQSSKGGLVNLTRALAVEWAPLGIRVNAVAPTYVETDLTRGLLADPVATGRIIDATPMRRLATLEEVADAVLFLVGPGAAMTTGHTLPVDGGFLAV
jgi:NAD(P)-dependent dehydrogenase (short-subunit alcohol dehydrogenase family)